ncbi:Phosphatidylserine/phosphatidylglycerophosphate/cardiolipin synthase [Cupriavidus sp. YR651]|uniref:phospholipase D family protein n=1 Tax=Cupriavidus sp. YR651 TaxID=1855315 RepID=UPI00088F8640|nr:phospholipase D family protein [Cupriavidus sp. YR651]SDD77390.1 Phosphatidylserine/phosphatidylglycerophosphate/cardiolipin synthase [Cupriavidus sp. YR651]
MVRTLGRWLREERGWMPGAADGVASCWRRGRLLATHCAALLILSVCLGVLGGCASLPANAGRTPSHATSDAGNTLLARALTPRLAQNPGQSIFYPLGSGPDALTARLALARAAQKTLDLQYYIFDVDNTGSALLGELIDAADRGVRVRILVDDIHTGKQDKIWAAVDSHPNIEVRIFNPFANRSARWLELAFDFGRLNRRMHNKQMTVDNLVTIVGGRNIGDAYFSAKPDMDFSDLDVMVAGPVVPAASAVFDEYWNSESAYAVATLVPEGKEAPEELRRFRKGIEARGDRALASPYVQELLDSGLARGIEAGRLPGYVGGARIIADKADKVDDDPDDPSSHAIPKLRALMEKAQSELVLVSPYFVPDDENEKWLLGIAGRGVKIRVLTNSFAATDVAAVHAGYVPRRVGLLRAGVELYELKPTANPELARSRTSKSRMFASSRASLHAKAYVVDRRLLFIGSLNLDPRSIKLNTEMGVVLDSPTLGQRLVDGMEDRMLDIAYKVALRKDDNGAETLTWTTREDGKLVTVDSEPGMSVWQHMGIGILRVLPVESQL